MSRGRKAALAVVALVALAVAAPFAIARSIAADSDERARDAVARLRATGLGVDDRDVAPSLPRDNGAAELERAFGAFDDLHECIALTLGVGPEALARVIRTPDDPESPFVHAREHPGDPACPDLSGALAEVERRLASVERHVDAALARPIVFDRDLALGHEARWPQLLQIKHLLNAFKLRGAHASFRGRVDDAWADMERCLALIRALDGDALLIHRLVRRAAIGIVCHGIDELLRVGPPPDPARRARLLAALAALDDPAGFTRCLRCELNATLASLPEGASSVPEAAARELLVARDRPLRARLFPRATYASWRADLVEAHAQALRVSARPPHEVLGALADLEAQAADRGPLAQAMLPILRKMFEKELDALADLRLTRLGLTLAGAELPERLDAAPDDPWATGPGTPLGYRRTGAREALVWSRGHDRTDDGGVEPNWENDRPDGSPGTDIVLRIALPPG